MKPKLSDYLSITAALVAILLCGYGIGFLVGERTTTRRLAAETTVANPGTDWQAETLDRLTRELVLTPSQREEVRREIDATAAGIASTRRNAIRDYREKLINCHENILPILNERQRKLVMESSDQLRSLLENEKSRGSQ
jgi:uncharacterized membrane protein YcjF (UPF0283 family)